MSAISEACKQCHNILELLDILKFFLLQKLKRSVTISNKNCTYELPNALPNDLSLFKRKKLTIPGITA